MGSLVKTHLSEKLGVSPNKIFHVTLMPCFDKKLEASRENFRESGGAPDVDLVITAVELEQVINLALLPATSLNGGLEFLL